MRKRHSRPERDLFVVFSYFLISGTFRGVFSRFYIWLSELISNTAQTREKKKNNLQIKRKKEKVIL